MNQEPLLKTKAGRRAKAARPSFNIVIVYEDGSAAGRAMNILGGLVHQFADEFEFRCELWRFDVLGLPPVRTAAARAGDGADLLIISASCDTDLPTPVKDWLNRCADGKTPGSAALVALLNSHSRLGETSCRAREFLQSAADRSLMDFFLHEVDLPPFGVEKAPGFLGERANPFSPAFQKIFHRGKPSPRLRT